MRKIEALYAAAASATVTAWARLQRYGYFSRAMREQLTAEYFAMANIRDYLLSQLAN